MTRDLFAVTKLLVRICYNSGWH